MYKYATPMIGGTSLARVSRGFEIKLNDRLAFVNYYQVLSIV
jgi:hypothetical protein